MRFQKLNFLCGRTLCLGHTVCLTVVGVCTAGNYAQMWTTKLHNFLFHVLGSFAPQIEMCGGRQASQFFPSNLLSIARGFCSSIFHDFISAQLIMYNNCQHWCMDRSLWRKSGVIFSPRGFFYYTSIFQRFSLFFCPSVLAHGIREFTVDRANEQWRCSTL